jgi:hypothetical protein
MTKQEKSLNRFEVVIFDAKHKYRDNASEDHEHIFVKAVNRKQAEQKAIGFFLKERPDDKPDVVEVNKILNDKDYYYYEQYITIWEQPDGSYSRVEPETKEEE